MRESDIIRTVTIRHKSEGASQVIADNKALAASQDQLAVASDKVATVTESSARRQTSAMSKFSSTERGSNPAAKALKDYQDTLKITQNVVTQNSALEDRANAVLGTKADKLLSALAAQNKLNEATQRANQLQMPNSAVNINSRTGVAPPVVGAAAASASVFQEQFALQAADAEKLRSALNPLATAQANLNTQVAHYNTLLQSEAITQSEFIALQAKAVSAYNNEASAIQHAAVAQENLRRQQANASTVPSPLNTARQTSSNIPGISSNYAAQFEAAAKAEEEMSIAATQLRASLNPIGAETEKLNAELARYRNMLDVGKIAQQEFSGAQAKAVSIYDNQIAAIQRQIVAQETLRRQQANIATAPAAGTISAPQVIGVTHANLGPDYAAQFEAAAKAQDEMAAAAMRLRATLNPLAVAQEQFDAQLLVYKGALQSSLITQSEFASAQVMVTEKFHQQTAAIQQAIVAQETLRRQQANTATAPLPTGSVSAPQLVGVTHANLGLEYAAQFEAAAKAQDDMVAAASRLRAVLNPLAVAQEQYDAELSVYQGALKATLISQQEFSAAQVMTTEKFNQQTAAIQQAVVAQENLRRQQSNAATVSGPLNTARQTSSNIPGIPSNYAAQFEAAAAAQEKAAAAQEKMVAAAANLKQRIDPLGASLAQLTKDQADYNAMQKAGLLTQEQVGKATALSVKRHQDLAQSMKTAGTAGRVMSGEMVNLSYQLNDVVTGLALGQSAFMIFAQQGGQVFQIFQNSKSSIADFAKQAGSGLLALASPFNVAVAGAVGLTATVAALAVQWDKLQVSSQRALIGAGERTGTTVSDLNKFTEHNSSSIGLSQPQARALGEDFTKTGEIVISRLHGMSDAVLGFANQTGQSMADARKAMVGFAVDPKRALDELAKTYGSFDTATRKAVDALVLADDKTGAFQVVIDALSEKSKAAANNMEEWEKVIKRISNALNFETAKPSGLENQLENARAKLNAAIEGAPSGTDARAEAASADIQRLSKEFEILQAAQEKVKAANVSAEFDKLATAADAADRAIIPEISKLEELKKKIEELNRAKEVGATSKYGAEVDNSATIAIQNQIAATEQLQGETARHNEQVKLISESLFEVSGGWEKVEQSTALALTAAQNQLPVIEAIGGAAKIAAQASADYANAIIQGKTETDAAAIAASNQAAAQAAVSTAAKETLQAAQNQLPVIEAVGGAAKMAAQYAADYASAMIQGKTATEATALAASNLQAAQAQVNSAAKEQLASAQDQAAIAGASNVQAGIRAQAQATLNGLLRQGVEYGIASAVAAKEEANNKAKVYQQMQKVVESSQDNLDLLKAAGTADEARLKSDIAYRDAIKQGATYGQAAAISANVLASETIRAAQAADQLAQSFEDAARAASKISGGSFGSIGNSTAFGGSGVSGANTATGSHVGDVYTSVGAGTVGQHGGGGTRLSEAFSVAQLLEASDAAYEAALAEQQKIANAPAAQYSGPSVQDLTALQSAQAISPQAAALQQQLTLLQSQPETLARNTAIVQLTASLHELTKSTNGLNSTMQDALSPYYTQDPRTSHLGYRTAATGMDEIVKGGTPGVDSVPYNIMAMPQERITVTPVGGSPPGNDNVAPVQNIQNITINMPVTIQGSANKDDVGRTMYQAGQSIARQLRAS